MPKVLRGLKSSHSIRQKSNGLLYESFIHSLPRLSLLLYYTVAVSTSKVGSFQLQGNSAAKEKVAKICII